MTLEDMSNATSFAGSQDGLLPSNLPDGKAPVGPAVVHVSRFRAQDSEKDMPTNDICGPLFNASSPSASLTYALGSRLVQNLEGNGCPLYALTWSQVDMPSGPPIFRLRASARRTSVKDFSGWQDSQGGHQTHRMGGAE